MFGASEHGRTRRLAKIAIEPQETEGEECLM
jgi:hypothetical protein